MMYLPPAGYGGGGWGWGCGMCVSHKPPIRHQETTKGLVLVVGIMLSVFSRGVVFGRKIAFSSSVTCSDKMLSCELHYE